MNYLIIIAAIFLGFGLIYLSHIVDRKNKILLNKFDKELLELGEIIKKHNEKHKENDKN
jgi:hypothetical protein